jgi:hypothetical protein
MAAKDTAFDSMVEGFQEDAPFGAGPWMVPDPEPSEGVDDE